MNFSSVLCRQEFFFPLHLGDEYLGCQCLGAGQLHILFLTVLQTMVLDSVSQCRRERNEALVCGLLLPALPLHQQVWLRALFSLSLLIIPSRNQQ